MMTARDFRLLNDRIHGTNRRELYGSDRAHFPYPHKLQSESSTIKPKFGASKSLVKENPNDLLSAQNYVHKQNMEQLMNLFSNKTK